MSGIEPALIRLGSAIAKRVGTLWLADRKVRGERQMSLTELVNARGLGIVPQRRLSRQFEQLAETIANNMQTVVAIEFAGLEDHERAAAILAVGDVLDRADLSDAAILSADVSTATLLSQVEPMARQVRKEVKMSETGDQLFSLVLRESLAYLAEMIVTLPSFQARALRELLSRDSLIIDELREIIDRMPQRAGRASIRSEDDEFELEYRREVARKLDRVDLFGVTLSGQSRRYLLSVAYIGLTISLDSIAGSPTESNRAGQDRLQVGSGAPNVEQLSVDEALSMGARILIRGEAGSGKTTLLTWLAIKSAQASFDSILQGWNECVPFFIQLRRFSGRPLPTPGGFLDNVAWQIAENMPSGWAYRVLKSGRALVLVDGVDEVPENDRRQVREWLADLVSAFPGARYVVTSRPPAAGRDWLAGESFNAVQLEPMSRPHIRSFIAHWHDAVRVNLPESEHASLDDYRHSLVAAIDSSVALRTLATNPLLCALICALNRDRRTQLPQGRMDLYRTALEMLLTRRDDERNVPGVADVGLGFSDKMVLFEDLAYWFTMNDFTTAEVRRVVNRIEKCLDTMPGKNLDAHAVYRHLLVRTGLLREQTIDRVDFIHKTFQEFLAAKKIVDMDSIEMLVKRAHRDTYREVIVMAAGHARQREREALLEGILQRSAGPNVSRKLRFRLQLLAVACLETSTQLTRKNHQRILACLSEIVPPKSMPDARILATVGEEVISLLPVSGRRVSANEAAATICAAGLIGGDRALELIETYAEDVRTPVVRELVNVWSYFPPSEFSRKVMAKSPLLEGKLRISDPGVLAGLEHLVNLRSLICEFDGAVGNADLELLGHIEPLRSLSIRNNGDLKSISFLANSWVEEIRLFNCQSLRRIASAGRAGTLSALSILRCPKVKDLDRVLSLSALEKLELDTPDCTLVTEICHRLLKLKRFTIRGCHSIRSIQDIGSSDSIVQLRVDATRSLDSLAGLQGFPGLRELAVVDCPSLEKVDGIAALSSGLRALSLKWCPGIWKFDEIGELVKLNHLDIQGSKITDLSPLSRLHQLRSLVIADCEWITDLNVLARLPMLRKLDIQRMSPVVDLAPFAGRENLTVVFAGDLLNAERLGAGSRVQLGQGRALDD